MTRLVYKISETASSSRLYISTALAIPDIAHFSVFYWKYNVSETAVSVFRSRFSWRRKQKIISETLCFQYKIVRWIMFRIVLLAECLFVSQTHTNRQRSPIVEFRTLIICSVRNTQWSWSGQHQGSPFIRVIRISSSIVHNKSNANAIYHKMAALHESDFFIMIYV
jgi:hypothetical protein